jgi:uncharacterized RDD family membrane protein YckC
VSIAPGWYKDPAEPTTQRWWDGEGWVGDPLPADQQPPPGPPPAAEPGPAPGATGAAGTGSGDARTGATGSGAIASGEREPRPPAGQRWQSPPDTTEPPPRDPAGAAPTGQRRQLFGVPSPPPGTTAPVVSLRPHGYPLAHLGTRLVARLIDIGLVLALNVVVNGWFAYQYWQEISPVVTEALRRSAAGESMSGLPEVSDQAGYLQLVILILAAALWLAYEVPAVANTGQTPGKRLLRIKVVTLEEKEQPLSFGRSLRRWNTMGLPVLLWWCFGIGFLLQLVDAAFALFDRPMQQALHDKSAHTAVVSIAGPPQPSSSPEQTSKETPDEPADPS